MAGESHAFKLLFEQLTGRLVSHGADVRAQGVKIDDLRDHIDDKIGEVVKILTDCQARDCTTHTDFNTRLVKIESSRGFVGKILVAIISICSAIVGGIASRIHL